jgi:hypothetical protein
MSLANIVSRGNFLRLKLETGTASEAERAEFYATPVVVGDPNRPQSCAVVPRAAESLAAWYDAARRAARVEPTVEIIESDEPQAPGDDATGPDFTYDPTGDVQADVEPPARAARAVGGTISRGG